MLPDLRAEGDFLTSGGGFADIFSADLAGYAVPTQLHPLLGGVIRAWSHDSTPQPDGSYFAVNKGQQIYLGYVALALAIVGAWRGRRRGETWFWVTSALLFFVLTLGPNLRIAGHDTGIPLPFRLLEILPFFKGNRYPSRYSVMLMLSVAPLVAAGAYGVLRVAYSVLRIPYSGRWRPDGKALHASRFTLHAPRLLVYLSTCLLVSLLLFEHLSAPLPDLRPAGARDLRAGGGRAGRFCAAGAAAGLAQRRAGGREARRRHHEPALESDRHGKRVLGGNTSRNPEFKFQYFSEDPTLARLIALTNAADLPDQHGALREALAASPVTAEDRARARDLAAFLNLRYVMVHRDKLPAETEAALRELLPVELVSEEGNLALYRIAEPLAPPRSFAVGTDQGRMALAEGWSPPAPGAGLADDGSAPPVFAERRETRLLLPLGAEAGQIRLHGWSFAPDQQVTLVVDGREADVQLLPEAPTWLTFGFPADPDRPPLSDVRLRFCKDGALSGMGAAVGWRPGVAAGAQRGAGDGRFRPHLRRWRRAFAQSPRLQSRGGEPRRTGFGLGEFRYPRRSRGEHPVGGVGRGAAGGHTGGRRRARRGVAESDARGCGRAAFAGRRRRFARAFPLGSRVYRAKG